jgi:hypothetical protein
MRVSPKSQKKRTRDAKKGTVLEENSTDATSTVSSSDGEDPKGIDSLLHAAASIDSSKKKKRKSLTNSPNKTTKATTSEPMGDNGKPMPGISTLLQVATTIDTGAPIPTSRGHCSSKKRRFKGGEDQAVAPEDPKGEEDLTVRPRGSLVGDDIFYPLRSLVGTTA